VRFLTGIFRPTPLRGSLRIEDIERVNNECNWRIGVAGALLLPLTSLFGVALGHGGVSLWASGFAGVGLAGSFACVIVGLVQSPLSPWGLSSVATKISQQGAKVRNKDQLSKAAAVLLVPATGGTIGALAGAFF